MGQSYELYSDHELIEGCIKHKRKYQELLYRKYAKTMYGICLSYVKDRAIAQDILQDGFIKVFNHISGFKQNGSLEGWIRKIITNTALDYLRKQSRLHNYIAPEVPEYKEPITNNGIMSDLNVE